LEIIVGDRKIKGVIKERNQAEKDFQTAIQ
jgi:hypothetical protein